MSIEEAIKAYLLTKTGITSLVSTRILADEVTEGIAFPAIAYQKISDTKDHFLTGQSKLERPIFQYTAYATTKTSARAIADQIKLALVDYQGTLSGIVIQKIELQNEMSNSESDGSTRIHTEDLEFQINYVKE